MKQKISLPIWISLGSSLFSGIFFVLSLSLASVQEKIVHPVFFYIALGLIFVNLIIQIAFSRKKETQKIVENLHFTRSQSILFGITFILFAFFSIQDFIFAKTNSNNFLQYLFYIPVTISALLASFSFIVHGILPNTYEKLKSFCICFSYIASVLYPLALYFETSAHLNSPIKKMMMVSFLGLALIYIFYARTLSIEGKVTCITILGIAPLLFSYSFASLVYFMISQTIYLSIYPHIFLFISSLLFLLSFVFSKKESSEEKKLVQNGGESHEEDTCN